MSAPSIALVGAGKMGAALLAGLARAEQLGRVVVIEPNPTLEIAETPALPRQAGLARIDTNQSFNPPERIR